MVTTMTGGHLSRSSPGFPTAALAMKIKDMSTAAVHEFAAQRELVLIEEKHTVIAALRKIVEKRVNGLGVVRCSPSALFFIAFRSCATSSSFFCFCRCRSRASWSGM
jgi:hypothetical protein